MSPPKRPVPDALDLNSVSDLSEVDREAERTRTRSRRQPWYRGRAPKLALVVTLLTLFSVGLGTLENNRGVMATGIVHDTSVVLFAMGISICLLILLVWAVALCSAGRRREAQLRGWWRHSFLGIAIGLISMFYVPVLVVTTQAWRCETMDCPGGQIFTNKDIRFDGRPLSAQVSGDVPMCTPCDFAAGCPMSVYSAVCATLPEQRLRLVADPTLSCKNHILYYFSPASVLVFLGFNIAYLYTTTQLLHGSYAILGRVDLSGIPLPRSNMFGHISHGDRIAMALAVVSGQAAPLYKGIIYEFRYLRLYIMFEGVLLVCFSVLSPSPFVALVATALIHYVHALTRIFIIMNLRPTERYVVVMLRAALGTHALGGILAIKVPGRAASAVSYAALGLSIAGPVLAFLLGVWSERKILSYVARGMKGDESIATKLRSRQVLHRRVLRGIAEKYFLEHTAEVAARRAAEAQRLFRSDTQAQERYRQRYLDTPDRIPRLYVEFAKRNVPDLLTDKVNNANGHLARAEVHVLTRFFLIMSIFAFLAFGCVVVGVLHATTTNNFIPQEPVALPDSVASIEMFEFAGYSNWAELAENCCCTATSALDYPLVEHWSCLNSAVKMKARQARAGVPEADNFLKPEGTSAHSGLPLRPVCHTRFSPGVCPEPIHDSNGPSAYGNKFYRQEICNPANFTFSGTGLSQYSRYRLW